MFQRIPRPLVLIVSRSFDYVEDYPVALAEMRRDLASGKIKRRFHMVEGGIGEAPRALSLLFSGANVGKLYVC